MKNLSIVVVVLALIVTALPVLAQEGDAPGTLSRVTFWTIRDGMVDDFEKGLEAHSAVHVEFNDPVAHSTWMIVTGKRNGTYVRGTFGHTWADFDVDGDSEMMKADDADSAKNITPYIAKAVPVIYNMLVDLSHPPASMSPSKLVRVIHFNLKQDGAMAFGGAMKKVHEAIAKTNWDAEYIFYSVEDGGHMPTMVLVMPEDSWAGFAPNDPPFEAMMAEALGAEEAMSVMGDIVGSIESQYSETLVFRPDLSYAPSAE